MPISPDTDVIYQEAIDLQGRSEKLRSKAYKGHRLLRDIALELLSDGFLADKEPEIRLEAVRLRSNQLLEERHPDLFRWLDEETGAIEAIRLRNEGIVAAGWAEQFALNSKMRRWSPGLDKPKGEIEP